MSRVLDIETNEMRHWACVKACRAVLSQLKKDGVIYDFRDTKRFDPMRPIDPSTWEDRNGRDFLIMMQLPNGAVFEIPVQAKSSLQKVKEHNDLPGQHIHAVTNQQGCDLMDQFITIIDRYKPPKPRDRLSAVEFPTDGSKVINEYNLPEDAVDLLVKAYYRQAPRTDLADELNRKGYRLPRGGEMTACGLAQMVGAQWFQRVLKRLGKEPYI